MTKKVNNMVDQIIQDYYNNSEVCMAEYLAATKVEGLSFEEACQTYVECMKIVEGDIFIKVVGGEEVVKL